MKPETLLAAVLLSLATFARAQQDFSAVEFHEMLVETSAIVDRAIAAGKTLDRIKADGLPAKWKSWEAPTLGTSRWLEILYQGLTRK